MKARELNKLIKEETPNKILSKYMRGEISLTNSQIDKLIKLKRGTAEEGHGGVNTKKVSKWNG
jgi:hypothetical protein